MRETFNETCAELNMSVLYLLNILTGFIADPLQYFVSLLHFLHIKRSDFASWAVYLLFSDSECVKMLKQLKFLKVITLLGVLCYPYPINFLG